LRQIITIAALLSLFLSGTAFAKSKEYGSGVHVKENTKVSAILETPDKYIGKRLKISGTIIEVCAKRGCWIYISSDKPFEKIQVKVTDGEIVFPMSAAGLKAEVEGVVQELKLTRDQMLKYQQHLAEEKGVPFDPASVKDERFIRLVGKGAVVEE
jgi:hypothetical protein